MTRLDGIHLSPLDVQLWADIIMGEIARDIMAGTIPADVDDFGKLHSYVDANMYGEGIPDAPDDDESQGAVCWNENYSRVQDVVHHRLALRNPR